MHLVYRGQVAECANCDWGDHITGSDVCQPCEDAVLAYCDTSLLCGACAHET
eukprot:SAG11_NODE_34912_length_269_cov_0.917647_1_plen_51_part_10